jgi:sarcosine oxidase subunit alpha
VLCDEDFRLGGRLIAESRVVADRSSAEWAAQIEAELTALPNVRIMSRTTVVGVYDGGTYSAVERVNDHVAEPPEHEPRQRLWRIFAKRCVLAAGAIERPLVFGDNDRPGIMLAGAVRAYLNRYAVAPGGARWCSAPMTRRRARLPTSLVPACTSQPSSIRAPSVPGSIEAAAKSAERRLIAGGAITRAHGSLRVRAVDIRTASGRDGAHRLRSRLRLRRVEPDRAPDLASRLASRLERGHRGFRTRCPAEGHERRRALPTAGSASPMRWRRAPRSGLEAAADCGFSGQPVDLPEVDAESTALTPLWRVRGTRGKAFVDFQNDVSDEDVALAGHEGFRAVEHLKRYTTLGMASDQGKTSNLTGLALMAELTAKTIPQTGTTTFRPPFAPVPIGALAGRIAARSSGPTRLPPSHRWAREQGAVFVETGAWLRAQWYPRAGETDWLESVNREVRTVRESVGVCDVSTLGKIDLQGADAAEFLTASTPTPGPISPSAGRATA